MLRGIISRLGLSASVLLLAADPATAAQVRGTLRAEPQPLDPDAVPALPSHTQIQVAQPAPAFRSRPPDLALFLRVESSLPLPAPERAARLTIRGFRLSPQVVSCAVDGKVELVNAGSRAFDLRVSGRPIGRLAPEDRLEWVCETGPGGAEVKTVSAAGYPFMVGQIYVGEVGVAARPDADGRFEVSAPAGTYELLIVSERGVIAKLPVTVEDDDVELGVLAVEELGP